MLLKKAGDEYDPTDRAGAFQYIQDHQQRGEIVTGLLYIDESKPDMHGLAHTVRAPLGGIPYEELCPGSQALEELMQHYR